MGGNGEELLGMCVNSGEWLGMGGNGMKWEMVRNCWEWVGMLGNGGILLIYLQHEIMGCSFSTNPERKNPTVGGKTKTQLKSFPASSFRQKSLSLLQRLHRPENGAREGDSLLCHLLLIAGTGTVTWILTRSTLTGIHVLM